LTGVILLHIVGLIVLLVLSAFFSGSEAALFSLSPHRLRRLQSEKSRPARVLSRLAASPQRTLVNILLGNTLVNVGASFFAAILSFRAVEILGFDQTLGMAVGVGVMTFILLVFGEITPKWYSLRMAERVSLGGAPLLSFFSILFWPISLVLEVIVGAGMRGLPKRSLVTMDEIKTMLEMGRESKRLRSFEEGIIRNVFDFSGVTVREIMTPRSELFALKRDTTIAEARDLARRRKHSRVPVYEDDIDDILGVLHIKDILTGKVTESDPVLNLAKTAYFVPETMGIGALLDELQRRRVHLAVVVDEHGGTVGAVTLDDILGEIVGDITQIADAGERPEVVVLSERELLVDGSASLNELRERLDLDIPAEQFNTVAGLVFNLAGRVPLENQEFISGRTKYTVEEMQGTKIARVRIEKLEQQS
jgi:putative hemolysin